jgi:hypothetical protein
MSMTMRGHIRHRLLVNYSADPRVIAPLVPAPFRPQLVGGRAVVGICALRLTRLRPPHVPARLGFTSDNAAHRVAVEWDTPSGRRTGVWVLRRDSAQRLAVLAGGRAFPGVHGPAGFTVADGPDGLQIAFRTADGLSVDAVARPASRWPSDLFPTAADASAFFAAGCVGFSHGHRGGLECIDLATPVWDARPVDVVARSTFFDEGLPAGSTVLDCGLLLRDIPVTWTDAGADVALAS